MISNDEENLLLTHEKGKYPEDGLGPEVVSLEGGQGLNQIGGSTCRTQFGTKPA